MISMVFYSFRGVVQKVTMTGRLTEVFCRPLERLVTGLLNVPPLPHRLPYILNPSCPNTQNTAFPILLSSSGDLEPSIRVWDPTRQHLGLSIPSWSKPFILICPGQSWPRVDWPWSGPKTKGQGKTEQHWPRQTGKSKSLQITILSDWSN